MNDGCVERFFVVAPPIQARLLIGSTLRQVALPVKSMSRPENAAVAEQARRVIAHHNRHYAELRVEPEPKSSSCRRRK